MPFENKYTKSTTYTVAGAQSFQRGTTFTYTATGNERILINETLPSGITNSGILFSFNTTSGAFLSFRSDDNLPIIVSGAGWNYRILLSGANNPSFFAKTGLGLGFESSEGLEAQNVNGVLYVTNPGNTARKLTIETLSDVTHDWGTQNP